MIFTNALKRADKCGKLRYNNFVTKLIGNGKSNTKSIAFCITLWYNINGGKIKCSLSGTMKKIRQT